MTGNRQLVLALAKEILLTKDVTKVAEMVQSQKWIVVNTMIQADGIEWCLIRIS